MKRFGFHPEHLYYKVRKPNKVRYLETKELGKFEVPMKTKERDLHKLYDQYQKRLEFEKYLCPKGVKPTITSRFEQQKPEIDFVSHEMKLSRTNKDHGTNAVSFRCSPFMSRPEIKQYLEKLYHLPIEEIRTINRQGEIKAQTAMGSRLKWRKKDYKKAVVKLKHDVDPDYQRLL